DPQDDTSTIDFQGIYETKRVVKNSGGTTLLTLDTCYNGASIPCTGTSVALPILNRTVQTTLPGVSPSKTYTAYNDFGLPAEVDEYDYGLTLARKSLFTYAYNTPCGVTNPQVADRLCSVMIKNGAGSTVASATFNYDANGNLLSRTSGLSRNQLTASFTHNPNGTLATATDVNGAQTTFNYNTNSCQAFPYSITPPAGPAISLAWD